MTLKKIILSGFVLVSSLTAMAQETKTENVFQPHWYMQAHVGGQYTLGEISFDKLLSPNAQLSVGYNFSKCFGTRLSVNAWQSKAGWDYNGQSEKWKWNYVAPSVDLVANLSNLFYDYNPKRLFNLSLYGGVGANIAFSNGEAQDANKNLGGTANSPVLRNIWDGTKTRLQGRAGILADFRVNDHWKVGVDLQANTLNDNFNSKRAKNSDWYFNALVGVTYNFGKTYTTKVYDLPVRERIVERVVEKIVEKKVPGPTKEIVKVEPMRKDIYFTINSVKVRLTEMQKVKELADFLKEYPNAKVTISGYADKQTGNAKINKSLSERRAQKITTLLVEKFGIDSSRISTMAYGDTEQPYGEQILNRVSICIAR